MATTIKVANFPMLANENCDTLRIQRAIKQCWDNNYEGDTILEFEPGVEYRVDKELCVYGNYEARGKKFIINGNGCTLKRSTNFSGSFGAVFSVYGLAPNLIYNPLYKIDEKSTKVPKPLIPDIVYKGKTIPASNITVKDLNIEFDEDIRDNRKLINGFGICNAKTVKLEGCTCNGAPQTNFAVISWKVGIDDRIIDDVLLQGCVSNYSATHSFRLSANESSTHFRARMYKCVAENTLYTSDKAYKMGKELAHLLCHVSAHGSGNFSFIVDECSFDTSGRGVVNGHCQAEFKRCAIPAGCVTIATDPDNKPNPKIITS